MNLHEELGKVEFDLQKLSAMYKQAEAKKNEIMKQIVAEENKPKEEKGEK